MAFFPKADPLKSAQRDLDAATLARDKLRARLLDAEGAISAAASAAKTLALDAADDATLDIAEGRLRIAQDRATTLIAALDQSNAKIATMESEFANAMDQKTRRETAVETNAIMTEVQAIGHEAITAIAKLATIAERAGAFIPEARGLHAYCVSSAVQIPDAITLIATLLGNYADAVIAGTAPATLRKPDVVLPIKAEPQPLLTQVFLLHAVKWIDHTGIQRQSGKWVDVELPEETAARALRLGICAPMSDPRRKQLLGTGGGRHP